jgi:hypothetical protein
MNTINQTKEEILTNLNIKYNLITDSYTFICHKCGDKSTLKNYTIVKDHALRGCSACLRGENTEKYPNILFKKSEIIHETWVSMYQYPNYQISNLGRVRNRKSGKVLIPQRTGYNNNAPVVRLCDNGFYTQKHVVVLMAHYFGFHCKVTHKDGNPMNNRLSNLMEVE